ncbi:MAG: hypothetical protein V7K88_27490 [Nostoc sp.]|uniref:hypothetical protein n=1 Tax=Nostoc sp. TaxID=1180 RepID=UPI002FF8D385
MTLVPRSKRTPAGKQATRSVSKSYHAAGFTLRYHRYEDSQFLYAGEPVHRTGSPLRASTYRYP